jgi:hypothetical protein
LEIGPGCVGSSNLGRKVARVESLPACALHLNRIGTRTLT